MATGDPTGSEFPAIAEAGGAKGEPLETFDVAGGAAEMPPAPALAGVPGLDAAGDPLPLEEAATWCSAAGALLATDPADHETPTPWPDAVPDRLP
jgi:hypothetical protein